jgi:FkbM family methyltransferase
VAFRASEEMKRVKRLRESWRISLIRAVFKRWPFARGKGALLRLFRFPLRRKGFLVEVEPGLVFRADLSDYVHYWCFSGEHEKDASFQLSLSLVQPGDTILDVGANIGLWAMAAAKRSGNAGNVHAFEPVPHSFDLLRENFALNGLDSSCCRQLALADRSGTSVIYAASNGNCGAARLLKLDGVDTPVETTLVTLDHYCEKHGISRVDFMKVDVEGAEILVFRGGRSLLSGPDAPAIMFEVSKKLLRGFADPVALKSVLYDYGYDIYRLAGRLIERVGPSETHDFVDLFAFKPCHFRRHRLPREMAVTSKGTRAH